ncbi:MAG: metallophosphoesterase [Hyphomicrobium sp.]|nr:metallophosphoesterase [Hyphomicrobium sp.]
MLPEHFIQASNPIVDPRNGDAEDDASSTKQRKLSSIAGSMLAEISLPKFIMAWVLLIGLPGISLGMAPLALSAWLTKFSDRAAALSGIGSLLVLTILALAGWYGLRPLFRVVESNFWALHALAIQPVYALCREGLSHAAESFLERDALEANRSRRRAAMAAMGGLIASALALSVVAVVWPYTRWSATFAELSAPTRLIVPALANAAAIVAMYSAVASIVWGFNDALMDQPQNLAAFDDRSTATRTWRVAHLSDIHAVAERYGFRIESGRAGPRGNDVLARVLMQLDAIHKSNPLDVVLISGDMTDAGRSTEWAEFLDQISSYPALAERTLILPGNHDLNVVDRANPARLELPNSPHKPLRQMRTLSAMEVLQGARAHVVDRGKGQVGTTLTEMLKPHRDLIAAFSDSPRYRQSRELSRLWVECFPLIVPPPSGDGIGLIILNSNAETNFSFTNALGIVAAEDVRAALEIIGQYPNAGWIVALHHHLMEYPMPVKAFSERIGTALINGSWFVRALKPVAHRVVVMHGHRHIDWMGSTGALKVVSAPSPVMGSGKDCDPYFYIHNLTVGQAGRINLLPPDRIDVGEGVSLSSQGA